MKKEAIEKLRAVQVAILAQPELYDQLTFAAEKNPCGSASCLAGWLVWLDSPERFSALAADTSMSWITEAKAVLGVRCPAGLFGTGLSWPAPFDKVYDAPTRRAAAKIAAARIEHFIATGQ